MGVPKRCYEHIFFDKQDIPIIVGSTMKVAELTAEKFAYGWSPEELHFQHPDLTMGQIYAALAYYADNTEKIESDIERRLKLVEELKKEQPKPTPLIKRLKAKGLL